MTDQKSRLRRKARGIASRGARKVKTSRLGRWVTPTLSVIVPIYNVEDYLAECLDSILDQDFDRFEVLVVDDGSPDDSRAIAEEYAARDARIRILTRENGGLGAARNTGIRAARGRYLTFVDSDDLLNPGALRALVGAAQSSGADVVVGAVRRFNSERTWRPEWTGEVHATRRSITAVEEFLPLLRNLYTWNKVFRKDFWDAQGLWFREGVAYEDQPIITQLFVAAKRIEVLPDVVYAYRERDDLSSISQQTATLKDLRDRIAAFEATIEALADAPRTVREGWLATLMDSHFHWYLTSSGTTDDTYWDELRAIIVELTQGVPKELWDRTPPAKRVVLELARQGRREDVWEFVRSEGGFGDLWPARVRADGVLLELPFFGDPSIPEEYFLLRPEQLRIAHVVEDLHWTHDEEGRLVCSLSGWAYLRKVDLAEHDTLVSLVLVNTRTGEEHVFTSLTRPEPAFPPPTNDEWCDYSTGTFHVDLPVEDLVAAASSRDAWTVHVRVATAGFTVTAPVTQLLRRGSPGDVPAGVLSTGEASVELEWRLFEPLELRARPRRLHAEAAELDGRALSLRLAGPALRDLDRVTVSSGPVTAAEKVRDGAVRITLPEASHLRGRRRSVTWTVLGRLLDDSPVRLAVHDLDETECSGDTTSLALHAGRGGEVVLTEWLVGADALAASLTGDDHLRIAGRVHGPGVTAVALVLSDKRGRTQGSEVAVGDGRSFEAEIPLRQARFRFGDQPLAVGDHEVTLMVWRGAGDPVEVTLRMSQQLSARLPVPVSSAVHEGWVVRGPEGGVRVSLARPLGASRGRYQQRRLRESAQETARRRGGLTRGVLFRSYFGELATDNGLSIQRELRRRGSDLPVYWAVQDRSVVLPEGGIPVVVGSAEWYSLLSSVQYYVDNMYQPENHVKPDGQVIVQTFHGYPFKQMGHPHWRNLGFSQARIDAYDARAAEWDYLVSPATYATPLLTRDFAYRGEVLEIGYPRNDVLKAADAPRLRAEVRASLGIRDDQVAVLYAPTFRDYLSKDDMRAAMVDFFDFEQAHRMLGDDYVFLLRGHAFNARTSKRKGPLPGTVDVTDYPEISDLYLAADVGVVDYSSLRFDFGVTGKPMLFHVPDLQRYKDTRGWLFDFEPTAPGPLLDTTEQVAEQLADLDGLRDRFRDDYARFTATYLDLEDGQAGRRFVERVFVPRGDA